MGNKLKGKDDVSRLNPSAGNEVNTADGVVAKKRKIKRPKTIDADSSPRETVRSQVKALFSTATESKSSVTELKRPECSLQAKAAAELARIRALKSTEEVAKEQAEKVARKKEPFEGGDKNAQEV